MLLSLPVAPSPPPAAAFVSSDRGRRVVQARSDDEARSRTSRCVFRRCSSCIVLRYHSCNVRYRLVVSYAVNGRGVDGWPTTVHAERGTSLDASCKLVLGRLDQERFDGTICRNKSQDQRTRRDTDALDDLVGRAEFRTPPQSCNRTM